MKIVEYKTAKAGNWVALDGEVNKLLLQGYHLYGNPYCVGDTGGSFTLAQAMVKAGLREPPGVVETLPTTAMGH